LTLTLPPLGVLFLQREAPEVPVVDKVEDSEDNWGSDEEE
jgi:hypothetical protein